MQKGKDVGRNLSLEVVADEEVLEHLELRFSLKHLKLQLLYDYLQFFRRFLYVHLYMVLNVLGSLGELHGRDRFLCIGTVWRTGNDQGGLKITTQ